MTGYERLKRVIAKKVEKFNKETTWHLSWLLLYLIYYDYSY
jgi:hypothetical protein